jgi:hypothetical protein
LGSLVENTRDNPNEDKSRGPHTRLTYLAVPLTASPVTSDRHCRQQDTFLIVICPFRFASAKSDTRWLNAIDEYACDTHDRDRTGLLVCGDLLQHYKVDSTRFPHKQRVSDYSARCRACTCRSAAVVAGDPHTGATRSLMLSRLRKWLTERHCPTFKLLSGRVGIPIV